MRILEIAHHRQSGATTRDVGPHVSPPVKTARGRAQAMHYAQVVHMRHLYKFIFINDLHLLQEPVLSPPLHTHAKPTYQPALTDTVVFVQ